MNRLCERDRRGSIGSYRVAGCTPIEIEPGRAVPNNWDRHLVETWEARKARRAREKAMGAANAEGRA